MNNTFNIILRKAFALGVFTVTFLVAVVTLPIYAHAATFTVQLELGDSGSDVSALQTFLASDSSVYPEGIVSGYFGALTQAAVKRYQSKVGLPAVGRVGPMTIAALNGGGGGGGSSDVNAPITTSVSVTPTTNSASVTWSNNESVYGRVMYGTSWPFLYATAPSVTSQSGFNTTQTAVINGLQSQTTYVYVLESTDAAGNLNWTIGKNFRTQ
jgi:peptidoglycan hydrolase-like protein with peptidoglycan-binding domain